MKKETEMKYPNAANLFKFCRRVLDHKYGGIRVIDQDVGQILGFDPADCSHWKKGKKNIRSIQAMKNIAEHLGIDEKLVVDVASGDMSEVEAYYEYTGYGSFDVDGKVVESAKKEFYRKNAGAWTKEKEQNFKNYFSADTDLIHQTVGLIHQKIGFSEAPLYLPEIVASYPELSLKQEEPPRLPSDESFPLLSVHSEAGKFVIAYEVGTDMRPYMRYRIAKAMATYFLPARDSHEQEELKPYLQHVREVEANLFASQLLAPASLIRREMKNLDVAKDIVTQLAEIFWVSKAFINRRLKDILQEG